MKDLKYYLSLPYPMEIIPDEGGFVAVFPDLPGCMSSGTTIADAVEGLNETKELWIQGRLEQNQPIPEPTEIENYSGKFVLRIPRSLHKALDHEARKQGVSLNQHLLHLLSERHKLITVEHSLEALISRLCSVNEKPGRAHPDWSWSEGAAPGQVTVFVSHHSKHDPLDLLTDIPGTPRSHRIVEQKALLVKREVFN